ncbi:MAG: N-acetylmuramoyl-L-alanine amidase [Candidatus Cryptobacteroides sp.]
MKILIDNGHGIFTPGKRSPDGQFREAIYTRQIARRIVADLQDRGQDAQLLVPEDDDINLAERCSRVNKQCLLHGNKNVICVSIHVNASGNGQNWGKPRGWSVYTSKGQTAADILADCLAEAARKYLSNQTIRADWSDGDIDFEEGFYILRHTSCPAVLTENMFMDNLQDLEFLESHSGQRAIIDLHVEGIIEFIETVSQ